MGQAVFDEALMVLFVLILMLITLVDEFVSLGSTDASSVLSITLLVMSTLK